MIARLPTVISRLVSLFLIVSLVGLISRSSSGHALADGLSTVPSGDLSASLVDPPTGLPSWASAAGDGTYIAAGVRQSCGITPWQGAMCWGDNTAGQLGNGNQINSLIPVMVNSTLSNRAIAIDTGFLHSCGIFPAGGLPATDGGVLCWGWNAFGQLGNGGTGTEPVPVGVNGLSTGGVSAVGVGEAFSCALTTGGAVKCWGHNLYGQLGNGSPDPYSTLPVNVTGLGSNVTAIAVGSFHACALTSGGAVKCWGNNQYGELGNHSLIQSAVPVDVSNLSSGVTAITAGRFHTCALLTGGTMKCWGADANGQLGNGTKVISSTLPVDVLGMPPAGFAAISAGGGHTCGLTSLGGLLCWGKNLDGQVGNGSHADQVLPAAVSGLSSGVQAVDGGEWHTCALISALPPAFGWSAKCWGGDGYGQLGDGTTITNTLPVDVVGFGTYPLFLPTISR